MMTAGEFMTARFKKAIPAALSLIAFLPALHAKADTLSDTQFSDRLSLLRAADGETGMAAGDQTKGLSLWGQALAQYARQGESGGVAGYKAGTAGFSVGADSRELIPDAGVGIAFSYGRVNVDGSDVNTSGTDIDSYQASLYGSYDLHRGYYLNGLAAYGWENSDTVRHNVNGTGGLTAHGSYDANVFSGKIEGGRDLAFNGAVLTPNLVVHGVTYDPDSFAETGAGGADLRVNGQTRNLLELGGGLRANWSFKQADGGWLKPQVYAGYRYAVVDDKGADTASFAGGGAPFVAAGIPPARNTINLGGVLRYYTTRNWQFSGGYDFTWRQDYTASTGTLRALYKF